MEKILIKPESKEIVLRGKPEDGHVDVFSYNYENGTANNLGGLFIVGQVQPATEDTSYMINLVASLAKREYYADINANPKDSFSRTLKKINEVLQDFFRNRDIKVNIGIFTIAGENILISRLGKFKIILSRDNQDIDILNNIKLFNKEHIQEKEFSNVISGKIAPNDKIFAFYPGRSILAREKNIKGFFTKLTAADFNDKLISIKKDNDNFLCAGIHLTINKYMESAVVASPQPRELRQNIRSTKSKSNKNEVILTKLESSSTEKTSEPSQDLPDIRPLPTEEKKSNETITSSSDNKSSDQNLNNSNVYYPNNKGLSQDFSTEKNPEKGKEESPLIRPSEFSSAKKDNFFNIILKKYKPSGVYIIGRQQMITKKQFIVTTSIIGIVIAGAILAKLTLFPSLPIPGIESEQDKAINTLISQLQSQIDTAKTYIQQNNLFEARKALLDSLASATNTSIQNESISKKRNEILSLIDQLDRAVEVSPSLLYQISQDVGNGSLMSFAKDKIFVYTSDLDKSDSGSLITTTESGIENTTKVSGFNPLYIFGGEQLTVMISKISDQIGALTLKDGNLKSSSLAMSGSVISAYPFQNNLYILTSDQIFKIADVDQGKNNPVVWLDENSKLPVNPTLIAIDGRVYILSKNGVLAVYYKGKKESEVNTSIPIKAESVLLTTDDSTQLYLVDKEMGRIYIIDKTSGSLAKTIKLNNEQPLVSASISDTGVIYLLTSDNKVWKVVP